MNTLAKIKKLEAEVKHLRLWLQAILDYDPDEICKDEFAYDRAVEAYRKAARKGLRVG